MKALIPLTPQGMRRARAWLKLYGNSLLALNQVLPGLTAKEPFYMVRKFGVQFTHEGQEIQGDRIRILGCPSYPIQRKRNQSFAMYLDELRERGLVSGVIIETGGVD